jgi:hypothetical protein
MPNRGKKTYPRACERCTKQNIEKCVHCKNPSQCSEISITARNLCIKCTKEGRDIQATTTKGNQQTATLKQSYPKICNSCKINDEALTVCGCCKKQGCTGKKLKEGRRVCEACAKIDKGISRKTFVEKEKKRGGVIFSKLRNDPAKEARAILELVEKNNKVKATHYVKGDNELKKGVFPAHMYQAFQFCDKEFLKRKANKGEEGTCKIRVLADGNMGEPLKDCLPMDDGVLKEIASDGQRMVCSGLVVSDFEFRAASFHLQDADEAAKKDTSVYPGHRDKRGVGEHVMFYQVAGVSFTFIAVKGEENNADFDKASQGYERYCQWKAYSKNEESKMTTKFEKEFMKQAEKYCTTSVEVYELMAGQSICFAAAASYHASIIPAQVHKTRRALLVFHQLETTESLQGPRKELAKGGQDATNDNKQDDLLGENKTERGETKLSTGKRRGVKPNVTRLGSAKTMVVSKRERGGTEPAKLAGKYRRTDGPLPVATVRYQRNEEESLPNAPGSPQVRKYLFLGMTYMDKERLLEKLPRANGRLKQEDILTLVRDLKTVQSQNGRDMWRMLKVEEDYNCEVHTVGKAVSLDEDRYSKARHSEYNWNSRKLCQGLKGHVFHQICVDYFWLPMGTWQEDNITQGFITNTIMGFAVDKLIEPGCMVVLPFTPHILGLVLSHEQQLRAHYDIEWRAAGNTSDLVLYTSTAGLDEKLMRNVFEKDLKWQEAQYITHAASATKKYLSNLHLGKAAETFLKNVDMDIASIRFIILRLKTIT